jgi:hypothetical protein
MEKSGKYDTDVRHVETSSTDDVERKGSVAVIVDPILGQK